MSIEFVDIDCPRAYPPRPTECTKIFWDALAEGLFQTTICDDCNRFTFPPKPICPHCWSKSVGWKKLSGDGTLYSRTVIHAAPAVFKNETPGCLSPSLYLNANKNAFACDRFQGSRLNGHFKHTVPRLITFPVEAPWVLYIIHGIVLGIPGCT